MQCKYNVFSIVSNQGTTVIYSTIFIWCNDVRLEYRVYWDQHRPPKGSNAGESLPQKLNRGRSIIPKGKEYLWDGELFLFLQKKLLDLTNDPYETTHFTDSTGYENKLKELREIYDDQWFPELEL